MIITYIKFKTLYLKHYTFISFVYGTNILNMPTKYKSTRYAMHSKCIFMHQIRSKFDEEPEWHALNATAAALRHRSHRFAWYSWHELNKNRRARVRIKPLFSWSREWAKQKKEKKHWINGKSTFLKWHLMFKPSIKFVHFSHFQQENWPLCARYFLHNFAWSLCPKRAHTQMCACDPPKSLSRTCSTTECSKGKHGIWRETEARDDGIEIIAYIK